jgi:regulator of sigma E protease
VSFVSAIASDVYSFGFYAASFIFVLTLIVFVHEYGHFIVARWCGVKVETFSIGFGREIVGWNDRRGTRWKVGWLPLGGYVKFEGDANAASMPSTPELEAEGQRSSTNFHGKPVWQRSLVVAAGPIANFILAIVLFSMVFSVVGVPVTVPRVDKVVEASAAEKAGVQPGDIILSVNGEAIATFGDIQRIVMPRAGEALPVVIQRGDAQVNVTLTPLPTEIDDGFGGKVRVGLIGISSDQSARQFERKGLLESVKLGTIETWRVVEGTGHFIGRIFAGHGGADQLGGPIAIAQISGQAASMGFYELLRMAALLSVSIGLINLFPIPMLDGGHLVYYAIEALRGRPLGAKAQEFGFRIGFAMVLALMVFSTWNDIVRLTRF